MIEIRALERKRDWNLSIHCPRVANRIQRKINRLKNELKELEVEALNVDHQCRIPYNDDTKHLLGTIDNLRE